jgi:hypothetical protein
MTSTAPGREGSLGFYAPAKLLVDPLDDIRAAQALPLALGIAEDFEKLACAHIAHNIPSL